MTAESFIRTAALERPDIERRGLVAVPDGARCTITEDGAKEIIRAVSLLRSIKGADALQMSDAVTVQWIGAEDASFEAQGGDQEERDDLPEGALMVVQGDAGAQEQKIPLHANISIGPSGSIWLEGVTERFEGAVVNGYLASVEDLAAHFDLPLDPPKPTIYITTSNGHFQHVGADDPAAIANVLQDITVAECGADGADLVQDDSAREQDHAAGLIPDQPEDPGRLTINHYRSMACFDLAMLPTATVPADDDTKAADAQTATHRPRPRGR